MGGLLHGAGQDACVDSVGHHSYVAVGDQFAHATGVVGMIVGDDHADHAACGESEAREGR